MEDYMRDKLKQLKFYETQLIKYKGHLQETIGGSEYQNRILSVLK